MAKKTTDRCRVTENEFVLNDRLCRYFTNTCEIFFSIWSLKYGDVRYLAIYLIKANISEVKTFKNALSYSNSNVYQLVTLKRGNDFKIYVVLLLAPIKILRGNMMSQTKYNVF